MSNANATMEGVLDAVLVMFRGAATSHTIHMNPEIAVNLLMRAVPTEGERAEVTHFSEGVPGVERTQTAIRLRNTWKEYPPDQRDVLGDLLTIASGSKNAL